MLLLLLFVGLIFNDGLVDVVVEVCRLDVTEAEGEFEQARCLVGAEQELLLVLVGRLTV